jgi:hypothetical protein
MAQFATADDLGVRLGITLDDGEVTRATALLAQASGLIENEARQKIELVTETITMRGTNRDRITLSERPVVSVASVTLDGSALAEGTDWYLDGDELVRLSSTVSILSNGIVGSLGFGFGYRWQTLAITYTHGYDVDDVPQVVRSICLEMAVRVWVNPGSVARESEGVTSVVYDNMRFSPTGLLMTGDERRAIRRFFGVRVRAIQIGG